jgi:hypothetical protein
MAVLKKESRPSVVPLRVRNVTGSSRRRLQRHGEDHRHNWRSAALGVATCIAMESMNPTTA